MTVEMNYGNRPPEDDGWLARLRGLLQRKPTAAADTVPADTNGAARLYTLLQNSLLAIGIVTLLANAPAHAFAAFMATTIVAAPAAGWLAWTTRDFPARARQTLAAARPTARRQPSLLGWGLALFLAIMGLLWLLNRQLDSSAGVTTPFTVIAKHRVHHRNGTSYEAVINLPSPLLSPLLGLGDRLFQSNDQENVTISAADYPALQAGDRLILTLHAGKLGLLWYDRHYTLVKPADPARVHDDLIQLATGLSKGLLMLAQQPATTAADRQTLLTLDQRLGELRRAYVSAGLPRAPFADYLRDLQTIMSAQIPTAAAADKFSDKVRDLIGPRTP